MSALTFLGEHARWTATGVVAALVAWTGVTAPVVQDVACWAHEPDVAPPLAEPGEALDLALGAALLVLL
ncbi:hypothetical protein [Cellulosimicrobium sp. Marseille-Q8652]